MLELFGSPSLIIDLCNEFNIADLKSLSILYMRFLWMMFPQNGRGIHKGACVHSDYLASEEEFLV